MIADCTILARRAGGRLRMRTRAMSLAALFTASAVGAQAPLIEKVDPPNWWGQHSINPVRVLIRGKHLSGARLECAKLQCARVTVNAAGTYAFVDITIPSTARPGRYPLTLRTTGGRAPVPFIVSPSLARAGRFQGFSQDDAMYLVMPDRFANGDTTNDSPAVSPGMHDRTRTRYYHGGDLEGLRRKLPYLKQLGITAIWLNPLYDNYNALNRKEMYDGQPITDYHGYGATDMYAVDEHFGDMNLFRRVVDEAHRMGFKIILDMVANHTGPYHPWASDSPTPTWFHGTTASHPKNTWQTWTLHDPYSPLAMRQATLDGWFIDILPDFNQDDPEVARYIVQNTLWWVGMSGMDGIRQDTWPYVPRTFWRSWMQAIKTEYPSLKVVGEVLDGDPTFVSFFQGGRTQYDGIDDKVDALFDFPMHFVLRNVFANGGSIREVPQMLARDHLYPNPNALVTLLGLHDVHRFMHEPGATTAGLKLAYTFLATARGTPLVYYGDEIAMPGGNDPDNRRDFPGGWAEDGRNAFDAAGRTDVEQGVWSHLQTLLTLRAQRPDLRRGTMVNLHVSDQAYVYRRGGTVVALNNGTAPAVVTLPAMPMDADVLKTCAIPRSDGSGTTLTIPARSSCVF
ncbi:MAG: cyclomaltodextrinase N-terminal domain-containing protein [Gemmatimonadaceae bacterium]|nr:cyclomaltodextrinase N-terminal domain-containing protein [Gemmatimonadaceae bacterium]